MARLRANESLRTLRLAIAGRSSKGSKPNCSQPYKAKKMALHKTSERLSPYGIPYFVKMSSTMGTDRPPPSATSIVVATAILAAALGYFIGQGASLGLFGAAESASKPKKAKKSWPNSYDVTIHSDSSDEEVFKQIRGADLGIESEQSSKESSEDEDGAEFGQNQGDLNTFEGNKEECKLVLVVRTDLGMGKGTPVIVPLNSLKIRIILCLY